MNKEGGFIARLRKSDDQLIFEFKQTARQGGGVEVACTTTSEADVPRLLDALGYQESFAIIKQRATYQYQDFNICLDQVEQLGSFLEIERMVATAEEVALAREKCLALLPQLDATAEVENKKYGDLMQEIINQKRCRF
jgi:adenylate cyclase class 2